LGKPGSVPTGPRVGPINPTVTGGHAALTLQLASCGGLRLPLPRQPLCLFNLRWSHLGCDHVAVLDRNRVLPRFHERFDQGWKRPVTPGNSTTHARVVEPLEVVERIGPRRVAGAVGVRVDELPP